MKVFREWDVEFPGDFSKTVNLFPYENCLTQRQKSLFHWEMVVKDDRILMGLYIDLL